MNRANGVVVFESSPIPYNKAGINNTMAHAQLAKNQTLCRMIEVSAGRTFHNGPRITSVSA